jgi:hypothetical protein
MLVGFPKRISLNLITIFIRINNLKIIQNEISQIQGYRLNVHDTVGPEGVII